MQLPGSALQLIKQIPTYGPRLVELFNAVQSQTTIIEKQGNLNATGEPPVPPPPDALNVTNGPSGEFQIAITHNGEFNRGANFHVQWDTSPAFTNPHNIDLGASRNDSSLYLPGQTAHFRASTSSPSGANSAWTYHGSQNRPTPVFGGTRGVRAPGMGSGTGAPGDQSGGPGPIQSRNADSGYNWKAQQRTAGAGFGASAQGSPAGVGASDISGGGGGGGGVTVSESVIAAAETLSSLGASGDVITGVTAPSYSTRALDFVLRYIPIHANTTSVTLNENSIGAVAVKDNAGNALVGGEFVIGKPAFLMWDGTAYRLMSILAPISATVLASDSHGVPSAAALADAKVYIGSVGNLPVAQTISQDATLAHDGKLTVTGVNAAAVPINQATVGTNASGQLVTGTGGSAATGTWTPDLTFAGVNTGITYSTQSGAYWKFSGLVVATFDILLTSKGAATGIAEIGGLPFSVSAAEIISGSVIYGLNLAGLTSTPTILSELGTTKIAAYNWGATGAANMTDANFTNTSRFIGCVIYET